MNMKPTNMQSRNTQSRNSKRSFVLPLTALALVAAACTSTGSSTAEPGTNGPDITEPGTTDPGTTDPGGTSTDSTDPGSGRTGGPVGFAPAALRQFGDCAAFIDHVHAEGVERVGPYGLGGGGSFGFPDIAFEEAEAGNAATDAVDADVASAPAATSSASNDATVSRAQADGASSDGSFSTTNVQVEGVDEPDIVKTDGDRIVAIAGSTLHYIDVAADGTTGTLRGSIDLNSAGQNSVDQNSVDQNSDGVGRFSYGHEIFLAGDRVFVFAQGEGQYFFDGGPVPVEVGPAVEVDAFEPDAEAGLVRIEPAEDELPDPLPAREYVGPQTLVLEIDASNPDTLAIANTLRIDGRYISARSVGDTARLVVTSPPQDLGFLYPSNEGTEDKAEEANRQVILDSTSSDWIPDYTLTDANGDEQTGEIAACSDVHAPADFSGFDMLSVVTLDLSGDLSAPVGGAAVMASGETVYASQDRLYVSTNIWEPIIDEQTEEWLDENYQTALHRFSIAGDAPATYEGSGSVEGHLLNQFSMNDREGVLYAATTTGAPWGGGDSVSQIVALELNGNQLEQIGSVGGLGETERIFSVRYVGDTAYVVTFRQTDPFYVVDLSNPREMVVQGELKIPGYSSYLHPISDDLVLGVGQDATDEGRTTGTKVSLFDVSDPTNPLEVDTWTLPNAYSDAEFDHRAFLWWAPTNTAVLPLQSSGDRFSGAVVLQVQDGVITEQGRISQVDADGAPVGQTDCRILTRDDLDAGQSGAGGAGGADVPSGELDWIFQEGNQVNLCTANQEGGATGMYCEVIPTDDLQYWYDGELDFDAAQFDRIEFCYQDWNGYRVAIQRTLVIDGSLWTLSSERIQSNDLSTLDRTDTIDLT